MKQRWTDDNHFELLENGEAFFPRVFAAIDAARHEVLIETFILFEDKVGLALRDSLVAAARRGVRVVLLIDGWGSHELTDDFLASLGEAGVTVNMYDPQPWFAGWRPKMLRRMHRKITVIDGTLAFVGGINFSADHLADFGPEAKQDYSVAINGPVVDDIHRFVLSQAPRRGWLRHWWTNRRQNNAQRLNSVAWRGARETAGDAAKAGAQASFVVRDNRLHRKSIEHHYRLAIRLARQRVIIANAYFFPGFRLLRDLRKAARRGVDVQLVLQGKPDMAIVRIAARLLHEDLLQAGVRIHEYCERPLHGKVALVDEQWATIGSSNLDPLSLSLNLEANVMIRGSSFNACLAERLQSLIEEKCREVKLEATPSAPAWSKLRSFFLYHALRMYPKLIDWLPAHNAPVETIATSAQEVSSAEPAPSTLSPPPR